MDPYTRYNLDVTDKRFFNWCVEAGLVEASPIARVKLIKPERAEHPAPSLTQVSQTLSLAEGAVKVVIAVGAFTGLRLGEICALKPSDIDLDNGIVNVRVGKTAAATRGVPIHPRLSSILADYDGFRGEYLFNAPASNRFPDGQHHLNPRTVNVDYKNLAKQAGLAVGRKNQGVTFHALRRFFKTSCLNAGIRIPRGELERLKTGAQPDGCAPVLRVNDVDDEKQTEQSLPGPKPRWQRRRG